jgi:hypothetical protein
MEPKNVWWMMVMPFKLVEDFFVVADVAHS